jgi:hypothetical protein
MLTVYRIISYLLIVVAGFIALAVITMLGVAFSNPAALLSVFLAGGVVLYSFASFQFLTKGITKGQTMKPGRKDFIKVNAYVTLFFGVMNLIQAITLIIYPVDLKEVANQFTQIPTGGSGFSLEQMMKAILWFLLIYALALIVHVQLTFRLLRIYAAVFHSGEDRMS